MSTELFKCKCGGEEFVNPLKFNQDTTSREERPEIKCLKCGKVYEVQERYEYDWNKSGEEVQVKRFVDKDNPWD